eukprot:1136129-Pelagomonas_calceolata.AAC.1
MRRDFACERKILNRYLQDREVMDKVYVPVKFLRKTAVAGKPSMEVRQKGKGAATVQADLEGWLREGVLGNGCEHAIARVAVNLSCRCGTRFAFGGCCRSR